MRGIAATTEFEFNDDCEYGALSAGSEQVAAIEGYGGQNGIPVHYQFYNPATVPFITRVPASTRIQSSEAPSLGVRVMRAADAHTALHGMGDRDHPTLARLKEVSGYGGLAGWSLQEFVVDMFLGCREGTHFQSVTDPKINRLFYRRSGPISAAIAITIEER